MATIYYGLSGEGRGHATRARVLVEALRNEHRLILCTYGDAHEMLEPLYRGSDVEVRRIPGLRFRYDASGHLDPRSSTLAAVPFLAKMRGRVARLARDLEREHVDLVLSDFEPLLPRAALAAGIPHVSIDHQHFLVAYDLGSLPAGLRLRAEFLARAVRFFCSGQRRTVVSSFFFRPLKRHPCPVTSAGVLLRREITSATPEEGRHLVAYVRRRAPGRILSALAALPRPVHVYGQGETGRHGNLRFFGIEPARFVDDLASARALVTTAGNQVVGEALALGKPVLAYPEPGNLEQQINGHFLAESGAGWSVPARAFDVSTLEAFWEAIPGLSARIEPGRMNGNALVLGVIEAELARAADPTSASQGVSTQEVPWNVSSPSLVRSYAVGTATRARRAF